MNDNKILSLENGIGRQGDVLIYKIESLPENVKPAKRDKKYKGIVLAYGEVTGHAHIITEKKVKFFSDDKGEVFLDVKQSAKLEHVGADLKWAGEHYSIAIPDGKYAVIRQREYQPEMIRRVED